MSAAIMAAGLCAAAATWAAVPARMTPTTRPALRPAVRRGVPMGRTRGRRAYAGGSIDQHAQALRQLAALYASGRPPVRAWEQLAEAWRREAETSPAACDILVAATGARTAAATGLPLSAGLERHIGHGRSAGASVWERVRWCLELSERTGASLAGLLECVADQLEAEQDAERARTTALAGPRTSHRLLALLPLGGLALAGLLGADPIGVLLGETAGRVAGFAGLALWAGHWWWSRRLLRQATT